MSESPREYRVRTWDVETNEYSAQEGIAEYVRGFAGLLSAVRELKANGYPCDRTKHGGSDPSVLIERIDEEAAEFRRRLEEAQRNEPPFNPENIPFP